MRSGTAVYRSDLSLPRRSGTAVHRSGLSLPRSGGAAVNRSGLSLLRKSGAAVDRSGLSLPRNSGSSQAIHTYEPYSLSWVFIFEALFECHDALILSTSPMIWRQRPDMIIAVD